MNNQTNDGFATNFPTARASVGPRDALLALLQLYAHEFAEMVVYLRENARGWGANGY